MTLFPAPSAAAPIFGAAEFPDADLYDPPPEQFARPRPVKYLAILDVLGGVACAAAAILVAGLIAGGQIDKALPAFIVIVALCSALAGLCLKAGVGMWRMRPWGRSCQFIVSGFWLLSMPIGTAAGALAIHYLTRPGVALLFSGRSPGDMSLEERAVVVRDRRGKPLVVVLLIVFAILGIALIGILAAGAAAALNQARASGNEASAIGSLRAMASGQAVYSAGHGGRYGRLGCLAMPALCAAPDGDVPVAPYLSAHMLESTRNGYAFRLSLSDDGNQYVYWAEPVATSGTGRRALCVDASGLVRTYAAPAARPASDATCPEGGAPLR